MADKLLTTKEVAQYLSVDEFTVYRLVTSKRLPAYKVGNQWRFSRKLLEDWLRRQSNIPRKGSH